MKDTDSVFEENLRTFGSNHAAPPGLSPELRRQCMATLVGGSRRSRISILRRPALLSTVGIAAVLATALGLLFPTNGGPEVRAATVLEKLSKQVTGADVIGVQMDRVQVEEVAVNGRVFLSETAAAGDVQVTVDEPGEGKIEVDASFGLTEETGWVLVRKLRVPEPEAQVFIDLLMPSGAETLVMLPPGLVKAKLASGVGGGLHHVREMAGGHVTAVVKTILQSKSMSAAHTERRADGTILLTVELADEAAVNELLSMVAKSMGKDSAEEAELDVDAMEELLGGAFSVIYDPKSETVRSFSVSGIRGIEGIISVAFQGGGIDPALLDVERVKTPNTRTLDLASLMDSVEGLKDLVHHHGD